MAHARGGTVCKYELARVCVLHMFVVVVVGLEVVVGGVKATTHLRDLPALVVPSDQRDAVRISHLNQQA